MKAGDKKQSIAVVGCGYWGKNLVRNFNELGALHTVCDINEKMLEAQSEKLSPQIRLTMSFPEILNDKNITGVAIATQAEAHARMTRECLLAGKDVFVEKPLALTTEEGRELVELAESRNSVLMVGHLLRYHGAITRLSEIVKSGELGRIQYIYSNRLNFGKVRREENILWSFAPHDISTILYLLGEMPREVSAFGGNYLHPSIADVTTTNLSFASGVKAHVFVSWLHPYKEQRLVVVGDKGMACFDDVVQEDKLVIYDHAIDWVGHQPVPRKAVPRVIAIEKSEPLRTECQHFLDCMESRAEPLTNGHEGVRVLEVLGAAGQSLGEGGRSISLEAGKGAHFFIHPTAVVDEPAEIGEETKIWHFSHVMKSAQIGKRCNIGQNVFVGSGVNIGNGVKIQNNTSVYTGVELEDDVFIGPSVVFTNVINPRSNIERKDAFRHTLVKQGATIGANATVICGITIGAYALIGAGCILTHDIPAYALIYGSPGRIQGWVCRCGVNLDEVEGRKDRLLCPSCGERYNRRDSVVERSED